MHLHRDHYGGTPFDMTHGPAGGPYGDPDRYDPGANGDLTPEDLQKGRFERAISIFRASYSFISILDKENPDTSFLWVGQYAPHATLYTPVYTKVHRVPTQYSNSSLFVFDKSSSFWVNALVGNWAARFYKYIHPEVKQVQLDFEMKVAEDQSLVMKQAAAIKQAKGEEAMRSFLTEQSSAYAGDSVATVYALFERLVTVYHDGYQMANLNGASLHATRLFYPKWWLEQVGFFNATEIAAAADSTASRSFLDIAGLGGAVVGRKTASWGGRRAEYKLIQ